MHWATSLKSLILVQLPAYSSCCNSLKQETHRAFPTALVIMVDVPSTLTPGAVRNDENSISTMSNLASLPLLNLLAN